MLTSHLSHVSCVDRRQHQIEDMWIGDGSPCFTSCQLRKKKDKNLRKGNFSQQNNTLVSVMTNDHSIHTHTQTTDLGRSPYPSWRLTGHHHHLPPNFWDRRLKTQFPPSSILVEIGNNFIFICLWMNCGNFNGIRLILCCANFTLPKLVKSWKYY